MKRGGCYLKDFSLDKPILQCYNNYIKYLQGEVQFLTGGYSPRAKDNLCADSV